MEARRRAGESQVVLGPYESIHDGRPTVLIVHSNGRRLERPWDRDMLLEPEYVEAVLNFMEIPYGAARTALRSYCVSAMRERADHSNDPAEGMRVGEMISLAWAFYDGFRAGRRMAGAEPPDPDEDP